MRRGQGRGIISVCKVVVPTIHENGVAHIFVIETARIATTDRYRDTERTGDDVGSDHTPVSLPQIQIK